MKTLYDENDRYTPEASDYEDKFVKVLKPLFQELIDQGFRVREIAHLAGGAVQIMECETVLTRHFKKKKENG